MSAAVIKVLEVSMIKRNLFLGLVTTAALLFAAPVAASEVSTPIRSTQQDVEQIRGMRLASKARFEGDLSIAPAPVPIAAEPAPAPVLAPASTPVEPIQAPAPAPKSIPDTVTSPVVATTDLLEILNAPQRAVWMLATDEAWRRVDTAQDYALGADLERGMPTLAAMRKHAPHLLPRALAILRAEQTYT